MVGVCECQRSIIERVVVTRYRIKNSGVHQQSMPEYFHGIPETEYATYVKTVQIQKNFAPFLALSRQTWGTLPLPLSTPWRKRNFSGTPCIWIFSAGQLEILAPGSGCGAGRDFPRSECTGRLYEKFLLDVRQALQRNPKTAGTILSPEVTQMDLPGYLPNCFIHGDIAGFRVYFNTGSSGSVPPTKDRQYHRAICKGAIPAGP